MTDNKKDNTEEKILEAAKTVFVKKGMDGTRMQEIADTAGINKALLHYYFRSKQKLYEAVVKQVFGKIFPHIESLVTTNLPIEKKLSTFIDSYIEILLNNPFLPVFVLKEINRDPELLANVMKKQGIRPALVLHVFEKEMEAGTIRKMDPRELMVNILGLCIFPFASRPLMNIMLFDGDMKSYDDFLNERNESLKQFILNSILIR